MNTYLNAVPSKTPMYVVYINSGYVTYHGCFLMFWLTAHTYTHAHTQRVCLIFEKYVTKKFSKLFGSNVSFTWSMYLLYCVCAMDNLMSYSVLCIQVTYWTHTYFYTSHTNIDLSEYRLQSSSWTWAISKQYQSFLRC